MKRHYDRFTSINNRTIIRDLTFPPNQIEPQDVANRAARPSIIHILIWTSLCAFFLATRQVFWIEEPRTNIGRIFMAGYALWTATCVLGGWLAFNRWYRRSSFRDSPGSWFLASNGLLAITQFIVLIFVQQYEANIGLVVVITLLLVGYGGTSILLTVATVTQAAESEWRPPLRYAAANSGLVTAAVLLSPLGMAGLFATLAIMLFVVRWTFLAGRIAADIGDNSEFDWMHWFGTTLEFMWLPLGIVMFYFGVAFYSAIFG